MNIIPLNDRLILAPSDSLMRGTIFVPESYKDAATSCLVVKRGKDVSNHIKEGAFVLCEVGFGDRKNNIIDGSRMFWCKESNIYALVVNNKIFPMGRRILIRREVSDSIVGGIVIPENRRFQSLDGTVERIGITRKPFKVAGIRLGDRIRLKDWNESMTEVTLEDGSYGLIVNESDLLYRYED